jgi:hypothetical protein
MGMNHQPVATVNLKHRAPLPMCLFEYATDGGYECRSGHLLSLIQPITLSLSKLSRLQRMASNDNDKCKLEEEVESSTARKRLWLFDDNGSDNDSSDLQEEETKEEQETEMEEEVSSE